jgi:hypothetical protein
VLVVTAEVVVVVTMVVAVAVIVRRLVGLGGQPFADVGNLPRRVL